MCVIVYGERHGNMLNKARDLPALLSWTGRMV